MNSIFQFECKQTGLDGVTIMQHDVADTRAACFAAKHLDQVDPKAKVRTIRVKNLDTGKRSTVRVESYVQKCWKVAEPKARR